MTAKNGTVSEVQEIFTEYRVRLNVLIRASNMEDYVSGEFHRIKANLLEYAMGRMRELFS